MPTKIEWCDETWNPVTGCTPISEGCANCYAARMAKRLAGRCGYPEGDGFDIAHHDWDTMAKPLHWRKPRRVFVCSMGDLFHRQVDPIWQHNVVSIMATADQHTYMLLTKRPTAMRDFFNNLGYEIPDNIWLGVTAENQKRADQRIPILLQIPAAKHFVSIEPMLGPVDLDLQSSIQDEGFFGSYLQPHHIPIGNKAEEWIGLDWVICGGENGPGARPMAEKWAVDLRNQCHRANTPFFFKGWGAWVPKRQLPAGVYMHPKSGLTWMETPHGAIAKGYKETAINGRTFNEFPKEVTE